MSGPDFGILVAKPEPPAGIEVDETEDGVGLRRAICAWSCAAGRCGWRSRGGEQVLLQSTTDGTFGEKLRLPPFARTSSGWLAALALESGEAVFGHGEKWGPLNHRGQLLRSRVEDALGVNAEASYKNTPFAWSPRGWGLFVHTAATVTHGVGHPAWSHRSYVLEVEDEALDLFLIAGDQPAAILERYTWLTGRPPRPPRWSLGAWFSRAFYKDADEVLGTARKLPRAENPGRRHRPRRPGLAGQPHPLPVRVRPGALSRPQSGAGRAARAEFQGLRLGIPDGLACAGRCSPTSRPRAGC